ncbi:conserved hypothetical protein [Photobacterium leiognathi lrivu.4.1]|uniref:Uncharacterized protein n=1 Tax=Photobacterium leiognathi lrivu.4.1 TaxID=1248232 RepID=V5F475_PHOLE|nr:conserved hypothetical protein [Photobacterium leiognathi lrivu.4.1]
MNFFSGSIAEFTPYLLDTCSWCIIPTANIAAKSLVSNLK